MRVDRFNFGPPVGFPVQFRVIGPDADEVREIADRGARRDAQRRSGRRCASQLGREDALAARSRSTRRAPARFGLTPQDIAQTLQTLIGGVTVTTIRAGEEKIDVVARAVPAERAALDRSTDLTIETRSGVAIPIGQVAQIVRTSRSRSSGGEDREVASPRSATSSTARNRPTSRRRCGRNWPAIRDVAAAGLSHRDGRRDRGIAEGHASISLLFPIMILAC